VAVYGHKLPTSYQHVVLYQVAHEPPKVQWEEKKYEWEAPKEEVSKWEEPQSQGWEKNEEPKNYEFKYEVHDEKTGDIKRQQETGTHGNVKGQYSLIDSDGFRRLVEYTADAHKGFEAKVTREKTHYKVPVPAAHSHAHWAPAPANKEAYKADSWANNKEDESPKKYEFKYEVHDSHTGDIKRQSETSENGVVKGQYSLIDADGLRRVVKYTADPHHGFQATVEREPTHFKVPEPTKKPVETHWW